METIEELESNDFNELVIVFNGSDRARQKVRCNVQHFMTVCVKRYIQANLLHFSITILPDFLKCSVSLPPHSFSWLHHWFLEMFFHLFSNILPIF